MVLKNILHLYMGCELFAKFSDGSKGTLILNSYYYDAIMTDFANVETKPVEIKPLLRLLSDMTEEEAKELVRIFYSEANFLIGEITVYLNEPKRTTKRGTGFVYHIKNNNGVEMLLMGGEKLSLDKITPMQFSYLLSRGFDLFGLLESKQAITKTNK